MYVSECDCIPLCTASKAAQKQTGHLNQCQNGLVIWHVKGIRKRDLFGCFFCEGNSLRGKFVDSFFLIQTSWTSYSDLIHSAGTRDNSTTQQWDCDWHPFILCPSLVFSPLSGKGPLPDLHTTPCNQYSSNRCCQDKKKEGVHALSLEIVVKNRLVVWFSDGSTPPSFCKCLVSPAASHSWNTDVDFLWRI